MDWDVLLTVGNEVGKEAEIDGGGFAAAGEGLMVVKDLIAIFCCLECRSKDFQQLNGRSVGVIVAMVVIVQRVMFGVGA